MLHKSPYVPYEVLVIVVLFVVLDLEVMMKKAVLVLCHLLLSPLWLLSKVCAVIMEVDPLASVLMAFH